jgi:hypothetical protein
LVEAIARGEQQGCGTLPRRLILERAGGLAFAVGLAFDLALGALGVALHFIGLPAVRIGTAQVSIPFPGTAGMGFLLAVAAG